MRGILTLAAVLALVLGSGTKALQAHDRDRGDDGRRDGRGHDEDRDRDGKHGHGHGRGHDKDKGQGHHGHHHQPTVVPTEIPTAIPTAIPTEIPTAIPTPLPTEIPTAIPTEIPTAVPTPVPTEVPTALPTATPVPTEIPTAVPTPTPTPQQVFFQDPAFGAIELRILNLDERRVQVLFNAPAGTAAPEVLHGNPSLSVYFPVPAQPGPDGRLAAEFNTIDPSFGFVIRAAPLKSALFTYLLPVF